MPTIIAPRSPRRSVNTGTKPVACSLFATLRQADGLSGYPNRHERHMTSSRTLRLRSASPASPALGPRGNATDVPPRVIGDGAPWWRVRIPVPLLGPVKVSHGRSCDRRWALYLEESASAHPRGLFGEHVIYLLGPSMGHVTLDTAVLRKRPRQLGPLLFTQ